MTDRGPAKLARVLPAALFLFVVLALVSSLFGRASRAAPPDTAKAADAAKPSDPAKPAGAPAEKQRIEVGVYVLAVPELSLREGFFTIDMYLWFRHKGGPELEQFEITNGEIESKEESDRRELGDVKYVVWRVKAKIRAQLSLSSYPFDKQSLALHLEHPFLETDALEYVPDLATYERASVPRERWGLRKEVAIPEYRVLRTEFKVDESFYDSDFGDPTLEKTSSTYSRMVFQIDVERNYLPYCYKFLIPLITILAIAYLVFFLPPQEIQTASSLALTSLLSAVALNFTIVSNLPEVGYLVSSDKFFLLTYILIFFALAETILTFVLARDEKERWAIQIERVCRYLYPAAVVLGFILIVATS
ncbi:MAG: hypothetical protein U0271_47700 [Polyangiaceae bacterium]